MAGFEDFFRWLNDDYGINFSFFYDSFDRDRLLLGIWTTVELSCLCLVLSLAIGVVGAWLQGSRFTLLRRLMQGYIQFFRNTPPLVQLYFFYFAVGGLLPRVHDASSQGGAPWSAASAGRSCRFPSSPAPSTSRSSAPASRRCRARRSRPPSHWATAPLGLLYI